ncbi:4'-phosphopantetheinyl transferase family protein [Motilibacter deserti]|uniref:4'-phosphopantetheinyl transferase superfamily protein n=1 Tax=Motilibacter deserti TaxID=2714956 RepID=A0ABX0GUH6_9ACTN|nr:4'-phosphopantetheinyl transferase superfamily protein [Motilibacter deserti]NHC14168.1 4'-phosphopantetheinyl transferase superfamily protein [Motilibacter deserti]
MAVGHGLAALLPPGVVVVEAYDDSEPAPLFPAEEALVARAVAGRRAEFATGRRCARDALRRLGLPAAPILSGPRREPVWPEGVVGSITHCAGYRAAVVALARDVAALGIDAEPDEPLPAGVLDVVARPAERDRLEELARGRPDGNWDRVLFSAKESVFKAWYPLTGAPLEFDEGDVVLSCDDGTFAVAPLPRTPVPGAPRTLAGRWGAVGGLVRTAVVLPA